MTTNVCSGTETQCCFSSIDSIEAIDAIDHATSSAVHSSWFSWTVANHSRLWFSNRHAAATWRSGVNWTCIVVLSYYNTARLARMDPPTSPFGPNRRLFTVTSRTLPSYSPRGTRSNHTGLCPIKAVIANGTGISRDRNMNIGPITKGRSDWQTTRLDFDWFELTFSTTAAPSINRKTKDQARGRCRDWCRCRSEV